MFGLIAAQAAAYQYVGCFRDVSTDRAMDGNGLTRVTPVPSVAAGECSKAFHTLDCNTCGGDYDKHGEAPVGDCHAGLVVDGVADKCSNGLNDCGGRNAVSLTSNRLHLLMYVLICY